ncbi:DoxX family protein [Paracoccus sp. 11-3]|uniref:DoxX family protein n=1 Tax=Paracoccus amoyensis TaxID=2760093 RepID=A0A926J748_9RHOB|nr:DoxX family protein [Paracoccus amoyensis]MBC9247957.1 DoxX family protein [Paracoccus amoyensis]
MLNQLNTRLNNPGLAALILRITLGVLFLAHAWLKIAVFTPAGTAQFFQSVGLPGFMAYVTIAIEVLGAIALIIGFQVRLVSLILIPLMLGTIIFSHGVNGFFFTNEGGGWEYPAFWAIALLVQALLGAGHAAATRD